MISQQSYYTSYYNGSSFGALKYTYCGNNPINRVDPTGMEDSPIYDTDGNFLGPDNQGLKGDAIVMKRSDFKQGMSHEEALSKSTDLNTNNREEAEMKMNIHYSGLKDRPDYDGKITLSEANEWYRTGNGDPLYADASQIDLNPLNKSDFSVGESKYVNFLSPKNMNPETGSVYGTIKVTRLNSNGLVKLGGSNGYLDTYDFKPDGRFMRDINTAIGRTVAGKGIPFNIYTYGNGQLKPRPVKASLPIGIY
jgi:hypothetical protein